MIISAYFSRRTLGASLEALRRQTFREFETIVVNSSPEEETGRLVARGFPEVTFVQSPVRLFPQAARNLGVERARGSILVFTDPDCRARSDWLERLTAAHASGHPVIGGSIAMASRRWLERAVHLSKFFFLLPGLPAGPRRVICTANASYTRAAWETVGPFRGEVFTDDALLAMRAAAAGLTPWFEPAATVEHEHEGTLGFYAHQFYIRGREFAAARATQERWGRSRAACYLAATGLILLLQLARAGGAAARSGGGWFGTYLGTLPLQVVLRGGWCLGEARAFAAMTARGVPGPSVGP